MKQDIQLALKKLNKMHRLRHIWYRIVSILACITVFVTTYALILPAVTLESASDDEIRAQLPSNTGILCCGLEVHQHTDECYDQNGELICGYADFVVHKHNASCFSPDGELICQLPEIEVHQHDASCENDQHELICGKDEVTLHKHDRSCYDENGTLICKKLEVTEHIHSSKCFQTTAVSYEKEYDGMDIGLDADEGIFPVAASQLEMQVGEPSESVRNAVSSKIGSTFVYRVMDIRVVSDEKAVSPTGSLTLTFKNIGTEIRMDEAIVCFVDSDGNEEQLEATSVDDDTLKVNTEALGSFVIASPAPDRNVRKSAPLRAPSAMTGAADAKYYTDRSGNIGVSTEGFTDATAILIINMNHFLKHDLVQYVTNDVEDIGGTLYLTESWEAYMSQQDWNGNAPFRITGEGNASGGDVIEAGQDDFRLEDGDSAGLILPAPNNPLKFDHLTYQSRRSSMNFWARGNKLVMGEGFTTYSHSQIGQDTKFRVFGGAEHQTVFTTEPKTLYPTNVVIESAHWDEIFGGGQANTAYGTNVTVRGTADIDYLAGGGDDEGQVGVYEQDDTKGDSSLKGVGVNVYVEGGNVETLYGGSRITPASVLGVFDKKALKVYTPVTVDISGGYVHYVYGMSDFTGLSNSSSELTDYVRNSYIYADSTVNISAADSAGYVVGDLYRNLPVAATNQRHVLGTTRANITARNSFERLNYFDVINISGSNVVVSSNESIGGSMTDSSITAYGSVFPGYVGQIAVTNGAKLVLDHQAIINNYYSNPAQGNSHYQETDRTIKANSYDDSYLLSHSWVGESSENRRSMSTVSINGPSVGITAASATVFNEATDVCGLLIHGTVQGQLGSQTDFGRTAGYSTLEVTGTPLYSDDDDYYYYIVADSSVNGGKAFKEPEGADYIVCYRYLSNGKIGWYLREKPAITMSNKLVRAGDSTNGQVSCHVELNGLAYEWSSTSAQSNVDLQFTKTTGTDGNSLTTVTESVSIAALSNIESDTSGRFSDLVFETGNGVRYLASFDYVVDSSTPTAPTYYEAEVDYHVIRNEGGTVYEDISTAAVTDAARCIYDFAGNDPYHPGTDTDYTDSVMDTSPYDTRPAGADNALLRIYLPYGMSGSMSISENDKHFRFTDDTTVDAQLIDSSTVASGFESANAATADSRFAVTIGGDELSQGVSKNLTQEITRYVCTVYSHKNISAEDLSQNTANGLQLHLVLSGLQKNGCSVGNNNPFAVNNGELQIRRLTYNVTLIITKQVANTSSAQSFPFTVRLKNSDDTDLILNSASVSGDGSSSASIAADGTISFSLQNNQSIRLSDIPPGSTFTLVETSHDGFTTVIKENNIPIIQGDTLTNAPLDRNRNIYVVNSGGYELPATGKSGIHNYVIIGMVLMTVPIIIGFLLRHSAKRRAVKR